MKGREGTVGGTEKVRRRGAAAEDLTGRKFGELTVLSRAENRNGRVAWNCLCSCGREHVVSARDLKSGDTQSCGCLRVKTQQNRKRDLTGQTFGWLVAVEPTSKRSYKNSVIWKCRCKCGKECEYAEDTLVQGGVKSCGCYRKEVLHPKLNSRLHFIDGTCVEGLQRKVRSDNRSGHPGVFETADGKWKAYINFKGKRYYLGVYQDKGEALQARIRGEEMHKTFLDWYKNREMEGKNFTAECRG